MKVGILTYHRVVNDGSILQAYCVQQILQSIAPAARVELVDYTSGVLRRYNRRSVIRPWPPRANPSFLRKQRALESFLSTHCSVSATSCTTDDLATATRFLRAQEYDAIVVGSDTAWEVRENSIAAPMAPNIFFLPDLQENVRRIAFAVSADPFDPSVLADRGLRERLGSHVAAFDFISVRDGATRQMVTELGIGESRVAHLPDPTLLWDFSGLAAASSSVRRGTKPIAAVALGDSSLRASLSAVLEARGYEVVSLLGSADRGRAPLSNEASFARRLAVYRDLDLLVTDRFHGSIFALTLGTCPIVFVEHPAKWKIPNGKGRDLFQRLGIEPMVWRPGGEPFSRPLLDRYLETWRDVSPAIPDRLEQLRAEARPHLANIRNLLAQPASVGS